MTWWQLFAGADREELRQDRAWARQGSAGCKGSEVTSAYMLRIWHQRYLHTEALLELVRWCWKQRWPQVLIGSIALSAFYRTNLKRYYRRDWRSRGAWSTTL